MQPDFLKFGKKHEDPRSLLEEIVKAFPNHPVKQKQLFLCMVLENRLCLHHVIEDAFDRWTARSDNGRSC